MSIIISNVTYTYMPDTPYQKTALSNVNLTVNPGEFVAIIGHTGSGKSTLIQHMNGLISPTSGQVSIYGTDINKKTPEAKSFKQKVGMVFQYPEHQLFEETIYEDIAFGPKNLGLDQEQIEERVKRAMEFVGLSYEEFKDRSPFCLSGGQMRRAAIAGVIALEPEYLVLDEPSAGLDPRGRDDIFNQIIKLHKDTGIAVILVSHNMDEVARMADRVIVMKGGEIILDGTVRDIFLNAREELLKAGVDAPPVVNLMDMLSKKGLKVNTGVLTPEEAAETILETIRGGG